MDGTLTGSTTSGQSEHRSRNMGVEGVWHMPQISRTGASPLDSLASYPGGVLFLCRDAVGIFNGRSRRSHMCRETDVKRCT